MGCGGKGGGGGGGGGEGGNWSLGFGVRENPRDCREKNIQLGRLIGMRFDGAATFSGDTGVQRRLKELSPHALLVHYRNWLLCKLLMLHQVSSMSTLP